MSIKSVLILLPTIAGGCNESHVLSLHIEQSHESVYDIAGLADLIAGLGDSLKVF